MLVAIPVLFELIFVFSLGALLYEQYTETDQLEQSKERLLDIHALEAGFIRYSALLSSQASMSLPQLDLEFARAMVIIDRAAQSYRDLAVLRPQLKASIENALDLTAKVKALTIKADRAARNPNLTMDERTKMFRDETFSIVMDSKPVIAEIVETEEKVQAKAPEIEKALFERLVAAIWFGLTVNIIIALALARFFSKDFVERLSKITDNAKLLPMNKVLPEQMPGTDEISSLDKVLHDSADRLFEIRRKESAVLNQAADVIFCLDQKGKFIDVGLSCLKIWQYEPAELIGLPMHSFMPAQDAAQLRKFIEADGQSIQPVLNDRLETKLIRKDGSLIDMLLSIKWSEKDKFYACVAHDDSARKSVERMKQHFLAMVSHDLRTPLNSVLGSFELLLEGVRGALPQKALTLVSKSRENIGILLEMINELLEIEKLESGTKLPMTAVNAHDICVAAKELVNSFAASSRITIKEPFGDAVVIGNERRLVQAMVNLLSNAIKFSPPDSTVTMSISKQAEYVELAVTDQGAGVPESDRAIIFEKFKQSRAKSDAGMKSTGLGLALVKATADAHNGKAGVADPDQGSGSRFFLRLTAYDEE